MAQYIDLPVEGGGGGSGTVTSVALTVPGFLSVAGSPITTAGTLAVSLVNQNANLVFAGPGTGSAAAPTFRSLVIADLPLAIPNANLAQMATLTIKGNSTGGSATPSDLSVTTVTSMLNAFVGDSGSGGTKGLVPAPTTGDATKFLRGDGTWQTNASGTVTSVALTVPNILSVSGSPVTTSGTLAVTLATQNANLIFAGPTSGGAATPTFRAMVSADFPIDPVFTNSAGNKIQLNNESSGNYPSIRGLDSGNNSRTLYLFGGTGNAAATNVAHFGLYTNGDYYFYGGASNTGTGVMRFTNFITGNGSGGTGFGTVAGTFTFNSKLRGHITGVADADYTTLGTDFLVSYTSLSAPRTVNLIAAATFAAGSILIISDASGNAGTHTITVDGNASETINGATTATITTNYGSLRLYCTGTAWITF